ncbi:MAG: response regulator [Desulfuromonadaceae bacterium]
MTDSKRSTVLVVDDTPDNLLLINGILCDRYNVKVATNGAKALRIARSDNPPDLILLDITMPGMDGYEVCRQLKSDARTRDIPVIFLTARAEVEDEKRGLELGAADYITRPISPPIVMARVRTHLDLKAAADSLRNKNQFLESLNDQLEYRIAEEVGKNREKDSQLLHQDKMASIGQLAAGVAHEINNPMGYVISNLASLSKYVDKLTSYLDATEHYFAGSKSGTWEYLARERKKYKIDRIRQDLPELICESQEGAERVRKIVQDLRSFSRLDNSTDEFSDINKGLESTLTIAWNELKYKATVNREYGQLPLVWCNLGQLNQVFLNILVNAVHAIEGQGEIRIVTRAEAESVKIAISDSGGGIAPEHVKRIFDPFFTTKEVGKGTGLGLAIAYDIVVNKHGGIIDVTSEIGAGTTFTITLPVKRGNEAVICEYPE